MLRQHYPPKISSLFQIMNENITDKSSNRSNKDIT